MNRWKSGNVDAGMVYKTDASISKKVRIACEILRLADHDPRDALRHWTLLEVVQ